MIRAYQQGVAAAVPAAVAASVYAVLAGLPSPLEAVAEDVMQWTPVSIANLLLLYLGSLARPAALLGALALVMLAAGVAAALSSLLPSPSGIVIAPAFLSLLLLILIPPAATSPVLVMIAAITLLLVARRIRPAPREERRAALQRTAVVLSGAALLVTLFSVRPLFRALATRRLFPFQPPPGLNVDGISELVTPTDRFYLMDKVLDTPEIGPPSWKLVVDGLVRSPLTLDYGALLGRRAVNRYVTMECVDNPVGGPLMSNALWTGVPVMDVLETAGARGDTAVFYGSDDYAEGVPLEILRRHGALLAYGMNGAVLPRRHGYPLRLLLPGVYGFKSIKWLTRIEVIRGPFSGHWRGHGWASLPIVQTTAQIDHARRDGSFVLAAGVAFAGIRGVRAVQVRINGGPWHGARLGQRLSNSSWVQWEIRLPAPVPATIEARAVDGAGHIQTGIARSAYPAGATGWDSVTL